MRQEDLKELWSQDAQLYANLSAKIDIDPSVNSAVMQPLSRCA